MICICCGKKVNVRDTWDNLKEEELLITMRDHPEKQFMAQCEDICIWAYGQTPAQALATFADKQKWGTERIAELERRVKELEGADATSE